MKFFFLIKLFKIESSTFNQDLFWWEDKPLIWAIPSGSNLYIGHGIRKLLALCLVALTKQFKSILTLALKLTFSGFLHILKKTEVSTFMGQKTNYCFSETSIHIEPLLDYLEHSLSNK